MWDCLFGLDTHANRPSQQPVPDSSLIPGLVLLHALPADGQTRIRLFILNQKPGPVRNLE
jgi:hypothetical protein